MANPTSSIIPLLESWRGYLVPTWQGTTITLLLILLLFLVGTAVRRLYFSPISHFPGPKLAAITTLYEIYYDVYLGGKFTLHLQSLHDKYGPIVRITPWEVHVNDPEYFDTIYSSSYGHDKVHSFIDWTNGPNSIQSTVPHFLHKLRRAALDRHFSKRQIGYYAPEIQERAAKLCNKLNQEYKGFLGRVLDLGPAFGCFATDVVTEYAFAREYRYMDYPDFAAPYVSMAHKFVKSAHTLRLFPILRMILFNIPDRVVSFLVPGIGCFFDFKNDIVIQIKDIVSGRNSRHKDASHPTIFQELLESGLPPQEKAVPRLVDEGMILVGAAAETTRWSLMTIFFHTLNNPEILKTLKEEIFAAWPDMDVVPTFQELEKLPYLTAIIQEGLRVANGVVMRLSRKSDTPLQYGSYTIPAGTSFSMAAWYLHNNSTIFPSPETFNPSRWLADPVTGELPKAPNGKLLTRYLGSFSRGTRRCLGIYLAYAEIYICIANIIRKCDLQLYETTLRDVTLYEDHFLPAPHPDSKGVRVLVV